MAGEQKRKAREALVGQALLLGYTFEQPDERFACILYDPNGQQAMGHVVRGSSIYWMTIPFKSKWRAAEEALRREGVEPYASKPPPRHVRK